MPSLLDVRRTAAALVAVALSAALIAFAFIVSDSYTTGMQADARLSLGGADAVVVPARPSEGGGPLDDAVIARLSDLDGVASVRGEHMDILRLDLPEQLTRAVGSAVLAQDVPALSERTTLTAGRLPQGPGEVAIDTTLAKQQELGVGDVIRLKNNDDGDIRTSPTVVGIISPGPDAGLDSSTGGAVYATADQLAAMGARTAYHRLYVNAKPGVSTGDLVSEVEQVVHAVQPAASVVDADTAVAQRAAASQSGGTVIIMVLGLLAPVCAVVAAIVIATTFTALVARQTRTTGLLRCIGASRRQVMGAVLRTAALTGVAGSVLGAGLGTGAAALLVRSGVVDGLGLQYFTVAPLSLAVTVAVGTLVTLIAVLLPARRAARVSPLVAVTGRTTGAKQAGRGRRWAAVIGLVLVLAGIATLVLRTAGYNLYVPAGGAALIALGTLAALPLLVGGAVDLIGRVGGAERRPILHLAARNLERNPGRSAASAATLFVCALVGSALFVGLFSVTSSFQRIVSQNSPTDMAILGVTPQTDSAGLTRTVEAVDGVKNTVLIPGLNLTRTVNGKTEPIPVSSIDVAAIAPVARSTRGLENLDDNTLIVGKLSDIPDGAAVTLTGPAGSTTLTARTAEGGWGAVITPAVAERLNGGAPTDAIMWVRTTGDGSSQAIEDAVRRAVRGQDLMVIGSAQGRDTFTNLFHGIVLTICLVMGASLVISLTGLANTTDVSILERTREIGVLRATGSTRSQIRRLITIETILLAVIGGVLGIIIGTILGATVAFAAMGSVGLQVAIPWLPLAGLLAVTLLVGIAASLKPAEHASRVMPVTALAAD